MSGFGLTQRLLDEIKSLKKGQIELRNNVSYVNAKVDTLTTFVSDIKHNVMKNRGIIDFIGNKINVEKTNQYKQKINDINGNPQNIKSFQSVLYYILSNLQYKISKEFVIQNVQQKAMNVIISLCNYGLFTNLSIKLPSTNRAQFGGFDFFITLNLETFGGDKIIECGICNKLKDKNTHFNINEIYQKYVLAQNNGTNKLFAMIYKQRDGRWHCYNINNLTDNQFKMTLFILSKNPIKKIENIKYKQLKKGREMKMENIIYIQQQQQQQERGNIHNQYGRDRTGTDRILREQQCGGISRSGISRSGGSQSGGSRSDRSKTSISYKRHYRTRGDGGSRGGRSRGGGSKNSGGSKTKYKGYHQGYTQRPTFAMDFLDDASLGQ